VPGKPVRFAADFRVRGTAASARTLPVDEFKRDGRDAVVSEDSEDKGRSRRASDADNPISVNFPALAGVRPPRFAGENKDGTASQRGGIPFPMRGSSCR
jgi:hypothetical protein